MRYKQVGCELIPIIIYVANTWSGVILREPPAGYTLSLTWLVLQF